MSVLIEVITPFTVKQSGRVMTWSAGQRMTLSLEQAAKIMERVGEKVRIIDDAAASDVWIDPPYPNPKPVFWTSLGRIVGPGHILHLAKSGLAGHKQY